MRGKWLTIVPLLCLGCSSAALAQVEVSQQAVYEEGQDYYGNLIDFAVAMPGQEEIAARINEGLEQTVFAGQEETLDTVREYAQEDPVVYGPYGVDTELLDITAQNRILSFNIRVSSYAGGPHPWGQYETANFDLEDGKLLHLSDLFSYDDPWAPLIQKFYLAMTNIPQAEDVFMSEDLFSVASEEVDRLSEEDPASGWIMNEQGLTFEYPGGTIGVYAAGDVLLTISPEELAAIGVTSEYLAGTTVPVEIGEMEAAEPSPSLPMQTMPQQTEPMQTMPQQTEAVQPAAEGTSAHTYTVVVQDCTWEQAYAQAQQQGGYLATITSPAEQQAVEQVLAQYPYLRAVWIGGRRMNGQNTFYWANGDAMDYQKWGPGEPNNETGDENFLDMYPRDGGWVWNDVPLDISRYYSSAMGYVVEKE